MRKLEWVRHMGASQTPHAVPGLRALHPGAAHSLAALAIILPASWRTAGFWMAPRRRVRTLMQAL